MNLSNVLELNSERGIRSALSALMFGEKSRLLNGAVQHQRMTETVSALRKAGYMDRAADIEAGKAYLAAEHRAYDAASRLCTLDAAAQSHGLSIDIEIKAEMRRVMDQKQIALAAEFSGVSSDEILVAANNAARAQFEREEHAQLTAQTLFYTAQGEDDISVPTQTVLNALIRERGRVLTFSNVLPFLGDLGLLKKDIEDVENMLERESNHDGENDGSIDNAHLNDAEQIQRVTAEADVEKPKRNLRRVKKETVTA